jgi:hypothetical protein
VARPIITLTSDFGAGSGYPAQMKAVLLAAAPDAQLVDVSHDVPPYDVLAGALLLEACVPQFAAGAVHLAVVDPGVGTARRPLCVVDAAGRRLVGPDNGLFTPFLGPGSRAYALEAPAHVPRPRSATFHGRDLFAPVAARLAAGAPLADAGPPLEPVELVPLEVPQPRRRPGALTATVIGIDGFGNVSLLADHTDLAAAGLRIGRPVEVSAQRGRLDATYARTFADVLPGDALVYEDAARTAAVAVNTGDAAATLRVRPGDEVTIGAAVEARAGAPAADARAAAPDDDEVPAGAPADDEAGGRAG